MYWRNLLHPGKKINPHFFVVCLLQMALTAFGGGTFHKSHGSVHTSALRSQFGVVFFRYSEEKSGGACLGALIPEKILLILQTENNNLFVIIVKL